MKKHKNVKVAGKNPVPSPKFLNSEPATNLFIKLVLVIVISSLFLVSLIYIMDRLWTSEPYSQPLNYAIVNEVLKNKNSEIAPEIVPSEDVFMCTMEYMPVCAWKSDGVCTVEEDCPQRTYGNKCVAEADKAHIIYEGECK